MKITLVLLVLLLSASLMTLCNNKKYYLLADNYTLGLYGKQFAVTEKLDTCTVLVYNLNNSIDTMRHYYCSDKKGK